MSHDALSPNSVINTSGREAEFYMRYPAKLYCIFPEKCIHFYQKSERFWPTLRRYNLKENVNKCIKK